MSEFDEHLIATAKSYGFVEPKTSNWIRYMKSDVERGEVAINYLVQNFGLKTTDGRVGNALDIGSGYGGFAKALGSRYVQAFGIEIVEDRCYWSRKRFPGIEYVNGNAKQLPWNDEYFDLIISNDVFEHVTFKDQKLVAQEIYRTLKPGGIAYLSVPDRFQLIDEHNRIWFGTYLPKYIRKTYFDLASKNSQYLHCYERTGPGWRRLFRVLGFDITMKPIKLHTRFIVDRWDIFLKKPECC